MNLFQSFFLTPRTFCGSTGSNSRISNVSGGGFFVPSGSAWIQYGIAVTVANATGDFEGDTLVFFMNVKTFKDWIVETVRQTDGVTGEAIKGKIILDCQFTYLFYS